MLDICWFGIFSDNNPTFIKFLNNCLNIVFIYILIIRWAIEKYASILRRWLGTQLKRRYHHR